MIKEDLNPKKDFILISLLLFFGIGISLYYGRLGFMPLDHSQVFDGGYRILSGQIPFRDFDTLHSIVPAILQAIIFKIFGKSWFFYCLHAALFNGLFSILAYSLLRYFKGPRLISFFYALLSSFIYYPPQGVPSADQHAFFFVFLAIVMSIKAAEAQANLTRVFLRLTVPVLIVIAFLCKQNPTIFAVPLVLGIFFIMGKKEEYLEACFTLALGLVLVFLFGLAVFKILNISFVDFNWYYLHLPGTIFSGRIVNLLRSGSWVNAFFYPVGLEFGKLELLYVSSFTLALFYLIIWLRKSSDKKSISLDLSKELPKLNLALLLILICRIYIIFTNNQSQNGIPYDFISLGILHIVFLRVSARMPRADGLLFLRATTNFILIFIACAAVAFFNLQVNATRLVNDIKFDQKLSPLSKDLPGELKFMRFMIPDRCNFTAKDLTALTDFLKKEKENFFLLGDTSILYGLTNKPSVNPVLWFYVGITRQTINNFNAYEKKLMDNIRKYKVRFIVMEDQTRSGITLSKIPELNSLVQDKGSLFRAFGGFKVFRLND